VRLERKDRIIFGGGGRHNTLVYRRKGEKKKRNVYRKGGKPAWEKRRCRSPDYPRKGKIARVAWGFLSRGAKKKWNRGEKSTPKTRGGQLCWQERSCSEGGGEFRESGRDRDQIEKQIKKEARCLPSGVLLDGGGGGVCAYLCGKQMFRGEGGMSS